MHWLLAIALLESSMDKGDNMLAFAQLLFFATCSCLHASFAESHVLLTTSCFGIEFLRTGEFDQAGLPQMGLTHGPFSWGSWLADGLRDAVRLELRRGWERAKAGEGVPTVALFFLFCLFQGSMTTIHNG